MSDIKIPTDKKNKDDSNEDWTIKLRKFIYKHLVWLLLLLSALIFIVSRIDLFSDDVNQLLEKLSFAIVSSGVFAAVLKSIQFNGIFKQEIIDVILSHKFLEKIDSDQQEALWRKISRLMYRKNFPKISKRLNDIILENYFPKNIDFFYDDYKCTLNIEELTQEGIIKFTQTISYKVIMKKDTLEAKITGNYRVDKPDYDGSFKLINEREYFRIDGEDYLEKLNKNVNDTGDEIITSYSTVVKNKSSFEVEMKDRREYSIHEDNVKLFRTRAITKKMDVSVQYPENLHIQFFNIGVIEEFKPLHLEHKNSIYRSHDKSLILKNQGFGMTFGFKKVNVKE